MVISGENTSGKAPVLGYVSLAQLQEYATRSNPDWSQASCRLISLNLFLDAIRMGVPAVGVEPEVDTAPERSFGYPKLINGDVFKKMLESGDLTSPRPYAYAHGQVMPKGINNESEQLAVSFIKERADFLGGQQE